MSSAAVTPPSLQDLLPPLRPELRLASLPAADGGGTQWRLDDPVRQRSFLLAPGDMRLLALWPLGRLQALQDAWQRLHPHGAATSFDEQLQGLLDFLRRNHLLLPAPGEQSRALAGQATDAGSAGLTRWIGRWMGWHLPLWRPQAVLEHSLPYVRGLWAGPALLLWAAVTLLGFYLISRQWQDFIGSFAEFAQPSGWLAYAVALVALKCLHELGHAYAAVHHGAAVPTVGLTIAYGMPMLYTDTSDAVRLPRRAARLWIGAGGMLAESWVAGLCTLGWALFPDGPARSICFVVASSSWAMTLAVNLNPLGRFDGYFMLADVLRFPNLQQRALDHAGGQLERGLFGWSVTMAEDLRGWRSALLAAYGGAVWLFRLSLGFGIAALLYSQLFQLAGVVVAAGTVWLSVVRPMRPRLASWWQRRGAVSAQRWLGLATVCVVLGGLLLAPLDRHVQAAGALGWQHEQLLAAPEVARIDQVLVRDGEPVVAGQPLMRLHSPELQRKVEEAKNQRLLSRVRIDRIAGDALDLSQLQVLQQQVAEADAALQGLQARQKQLLVRAEADGVIADLPPAGLAGRWVRSDQVLGRVLIGRSLDVVAYIDEASLQRLQTGAQARFVADDLRVPRLPLVLTAIDPAAAEEITPDFLASAHGGPIHTLTDKDGRDTPQRALHRARFAVPMNEDTPIGLRQLRGQVVVDAEPQSLAGQAIHRLQAIVLRELH